VTGDVSLLLVRHGETRWNEEGRLLGWTDLPLSERGRETARACRERLAGERFDGLWSSGLRRAVDTARLATGREAETTAALRELDFGELEGTSFAALPAPTRAALLDFEGFAAPGGESVATLEARVTGFLRGLPPGRHLLVTHAGVVRLLTRRAGLPDGRIPPGSMVSLRLVASRPGHPPIVAPKSRPTR